METDASNVLPLGGGPLGPFARSQYSALATLRWRMLVNGLRSRKGALELGARTFSFLMYAVMGMAMGSGAGVAAYFLLAGGESCYLPILFWVLLFAWQMAAVMLASFQEQFDLGILLRFPVSFFSYAILYLVFGLLDASTILGGLSCLGIWFGLAAARPSLLLWATPALVFFAAFNVLLARAVFAWIERWLAQRKTREILGAVFMVAVIGVQLFNPAIYGTKQAGQTQQQKPDVHLGALESRYAPLLNLAKNLQGWLPPGLAAQAIVQPMDRPSPGSLAALGLLLGCSLPVFAGLAIRLNREYRGENLSMAPKRGKQVLRQDAAAAPVREGNLLGMFAQDAQAQSAAAAVSAIVEKEVRALLRTLPLLYAVVAPLALVVVFATVFLKGGAAPVSTFRFSLPLCVVYAQLGFTQILYNNLGAEGAAIQLYFLSPTTIRTAMLAKNLLHSLLFVAVAVLAGVLASLRLGIPDAAVILATAGWIVFSLVANLTAGNVLSVKMAYRTHPGKLSKQPGSQANGLLSLLIQLGQLVVGAAVFALSWYLHRVWLAVPVFLLLAAAASVAWWQVLGRIDAMANERRDKIIATLMKEG